MRRPLRSVYEGSSAELRTSYADKVGAAAAPTSLSYQIINPTTGSEVREATEIEPDETVDILIKPDDNMLTAGASQERRRVIVTASYGMDDVLIGVYEYLVVSPGIRSLLG